MPATASSPASSSAVMTSTTLPSSTTRRTRQEPGRQRLPQTPLSSFRLCRKVAVVGVAGAVALVLSVKTIVFLLMLHHYNPHSNDLQKHKASAAIMNNNAGSLLFREQVHNNKSDPADATRQQPQQKPQQPAAKTLETNQDEKELLSRHGIPWYACDPNHCSFTNLYHDDSNNGEGEYYYPNRILAFAERRGLSDRTKCLRTLTAIAGLLCAKLVVPPPMAWLTPKHDNNNFNNNNHGTIQWSDWYDIYYYTSKGPVPAIVTAHPLLFRGQRQLAKKGGSGLAAARIHKLGKKDQQQQQRQEQQQQQWTQVKQFAGNNNNNNSNGVLPLPLSRFRFWYVRTTRNKDVAANLTQLLHFVSQQQQQAAARPHLYNNSTNTTRNNKSMTTVAFVWDLRSLSTYESILQMAKALSEQRNAIEKNGALFPTPTTTTTTTTEENNAPSHKDGPPNKQTKHGLFPHLKDAIPKLQKNADHLMGCEYREIRPSLPIRQLARQVLENVFFSLDDDSSNSTSANKGRIEQSQNKSKNNQNNSNINNFIWPFGILHIRRTDSKNSCDTSLTRMQQYLTCTFQGTGPRSMRQTLLAQKQKQQQQHGSSSNNLQPPPPYVMFLASDEPNMTYRQEILNLIQQQHPPSLWRAVDLDQEIRNVLLRKNQQQQWFSNSNYLVYLIGITLRRHLQWGRFYQSWGYGPFLELKRHDACPICSQNQVQAILEELYSQS